MSRSADRRRFRSVAFSIALGAATSIGAASFDSANAAPGPSVAAPAGPWSAIGRPATSAELKAWDIDVRADFKGLPPGSGSVARGQAVWEAQCASCHGVFGESNEVFTPIVGGTTQADIASGRVKALTESGQPHRTTLMKLSHVSTLWDYIRRAMPWNAPKSLSVDDVYATTAYILSLGNVVPSDFVLSDANIASVQERLPNRNGKVFDRDRWETKGRGDVANPACMRDCPVEGRVTSSYPDEMIGSNGNLAEQSRGIGPMRGIAPRSAQAQADAAPQPSDRGAPQPSELLAKNACSACHGVDQRLVGPALAEVAKKYAGRADRTDYLASRIRTGGSGVWGQVPMPPQPQVSEADLKTLAHWIAEGAR